MAQNQFDEDDETNSSALPLDAQDRESTSMESPGHQLATEADPVNDATKTADATPAAPSDGSQTQSDPSAMSPQDQADDDALNAPAVPASQSAQPSQPSQAQTPRAPAPQPDSGSQDSGDSLAQPSDDNAAPRQRIRQIGQITPITEPQIFHARSSDPQAEAMAQAQGQQMAAQQMQQASMAQRQQIGQINASDPIQDENGRWVKDSVDPFTGAINRTDILDSGMAKTDRNTGDLYVQSSSGPIKVGEDPNAKYLIGLVAQRRQLTLNGTDFDHQVAADRAQLSDVTKQLATFKGIPDDLQRAVDSAQLGLSNDPAAQALLKSTQAELADWKSDHPEYAGLISSKNALTADITSKLNAKTANDAAIRTNLDSQDYVRFNNAIPPVDNTPPATSTDTTIRSVLERTNDISATAGIPHGAAYFQALTEAKANGATTIQGQPIADVIAATNPDKFLPQMQPAQIRGLMQSGAITKDQAVTAFKARTDAANQAQATADNGVGGIQDFTLRAVSKFSSVVNHAGEGLSRWAAQITGDTPTQADDSAGIRGVQNFADLAQYFKGNADDIDAIDHGQGGLTNPSKNKSIGAGVADALGFMGALWAGTTAAAPLLPEIGTAGGIGGIVAAGRALRLGLASYKMLPALAIMAPMASAEAYDQAKATGASDVEATQQGMIAAAKQIPMIATYAVGGKLAGALESKLLPGVISPLARGATRFVTGGAANVGASTALRAGENAVAALGVPGMQSQPVMPNRENLVSDLAFAGHGALEAAVREAGLPKIIGAAQDIMAGSDPVHQALVKTSQDAATPPGLAQKYAARAAQMQADAEAFLKQIGSKNPGAQAAGNAYDAATAAKAKAVSAQTDAATGPGGEVGQLGDIGQRLDNLSQTEKQYHGAAQRMVDQVPDNFQRAIYKAAAPEVDYDAAKANGASSLVKYFAGGELGNGLRDQYVSPEVQANLVKAAQAKGIDPALVNHVIDQAVGARVVRDLMAVVRGESITEGKAKILTSMGMLQQNGDGSEPLRVTDDALHLLPPTMQKAVIAHPDKVRFTGTPGQPADGLNSITDAGMARMAGTARMLGEPPAKGKAGEQNTRNSDPSARIAETAAKPVAPNTREEITAALAQHQQKLNAAGDAEKPAIIAQMRALNERGKLLGAVAETDRNAKAAAFQKAAPDVIDAARQQVNQFGNKFGRVFGGVDVNPRADGTGGVSFNRTKGKLQISWPEIHNSAGITYAEALRSGATVEQAREAAQGKVRSLLDEELRHAADVRANGDAATKALWESLPPEIQAATRKAYSRNQPKTTETLSPTQLGYEYKRILSQQTTTGEISELKSATVQAARDAAPQAGRGWVAVVRAQIAKLVDFLKGNGAGETAKQLDKLHAELGRITSEAASRPPDRIPGLESDPVAQASQSTQPGKPIDVASLTPSQQRILDSARRAYGSNRALFEALGVKPPAVEGVEHGGMAMDGAKLAIDPIIMEHDLAGATGADGEPLSDQAHNALMHERLREEMVHRISRLAEGDDFEKNHAAIWNDPNVDPKLKDGAASSYNNFDKLEDWQKGAEMMRMVLSGKWHGTITERIFKAVQNFVDYLRGMNPEASKSPLFRDMVARAEKVLADAQLTARRAGIESAHGNDSIPGLDAGLETRGERPGEVPGERQPAAPEGRGRGEGETDSQQPLEKSGSTEGSKSGPTGEHSQEHDEHGAIPADASTDFLPPGDEGAGDEDSQGTARLTAEQQAEQDRQRDEYHREMEEATMRQAGYMPLHEAVAQMGGIPSKAHRLRASYGEEANRVLDAIAAHNDRAPKGKGILNSHLFKTDAPSADQTAQRLGFHDHNELFSALETELTHGPTHWTNPEQDHMGDGLIHASSAKDGTPDMFAPRLDEQALADAPLRAKNLADVWKRLTAKMGRGEALTQGEQGAYALAEKELGQKYLFTEPTPEEAEASRQAAAKQSVVNEILRRQKQRLAGGPIQSNADLFTGKPEAESSGQGRLFASAVRADQDEKAAPFYSQLSRTVDALPQSTMTADQARAAVSKGAKPDEVRMSGILSDPLSPLFGKQPGEKVSKADLQSYAMERQAKTKDTSLANRITPDAVKGFSEMIEDAVHGWDGEAMNQEEYPGSARDSKEAARNGEMALHSLQHGEIHDAIHYVREASELAKNHSSNDDFGPWEDARAFADELNKTEARYSEYQLPGAEPDSYREQIVSWPESKIQDVAQRKFGRKINQLTPSEFKQAKEEAAGWRDGHSNYADIANPIVRVRSNLRTDTAGNKMLFLEEMQGPNHDNQAKMPPEVRKRIYEIGMKRAMREAADSGATHLGWTRGQDQVDRYSLEKHVKSLAVSKSSDGTYKLQFPVEHRLPMQDGISEAQLPEFIGKDLARKAIDDLKTKSSEVYEGADLKIGGEGLKALYDQTLPRIANEIGRKFGAKTGEANIDATADSGGGYEIGPRGVQRKGSGEPVAIHSIEIPAALRDKARNEGFPLFASKASGARIPGLDGGYHYPEARTVEQYGPKDRQTAKASYNEPEPIRELHDAIERNLADNAGMMRDYLHGSSGQTHDADELPRETREGSAPEANGRQVSDNEEKGQLRLFASKAGEESLDHSKPETHEELPARREPTPAESARDEMLNSMAERPQKILRARLAGYTPEEMGAELGMAPDVAEKASTNLSKEVAKRLTDKGISPEEAEAVLSSSPEQAFRAAYQRAAQTVASAKGELSLRGLRDSVAAKKDAIDTKANYAGTKAANSIRLDLPDKADRQAMPFVIEAGDSLPKLQEERAKIETSKKPKLAAEMLPHVDHAIANFDRLNKLKGNHEKIMADSMDRLTKAGYDIGHAADYIHRVLDDPQAGNDLHPNPLFAMGDGGSGAARHFMRERDFETLGDAIHEGFKPRSLDVADLAHRRIEAGEKLVLQKEQFNDWKSTPSPSDGKPVIGKMETRKLANGETESRVPDGYGVVNANGTPLVVHNDVAPLMKSLYGDSVIRRSAVGRGLLKAAAIGKQYTLFLDTFHVGRQLYKMAVSGGGLPIDMSSGSPRWNIHNGRSLLEYSDADLSRAVAARQIEASDAKWARENRPKAEKLMSAGLNIGSISDNLAEQAKMHVPGTGKLNDWIFSKLSRSAMLQSAITNLERNLANPRMNEGQAYRQTAKESNELFGNLGSQGIFKSKTMQDMARLMFLAPQWTESQFRNELRAYGQAGKSVVDAATGKGLRMGNATRIFATGFVGMLAANQVLNFLSRGQTTFQNKEKGHEFDAFIPGGQRGFWFNPMEISAEYTHAAMKYLAQNENGVDVAAHIASNKMSGLGRGLTEGISGRDYAGKRFLSDADRARAVATDVLPSPMPLSGVVEKDPRQPLGYRLNRQPGSLEKQALSSVGMKVSPAQSPISQMFAIAQPFRADRQRNDIAGEFSELRRALDNRNVSAVKDEIQGLLDKGHGIDAIARAVGIHNGGAIPPQLFTGSGDREHNMLKNLSPDQREIYNAAQKEHQTNARMFLDIAHNAFRPQMAGR